MEVNTTWELVTASHVVEPLYLVVKGRQEKIDSRKGLRLTFALAFDLEGKDPTYNWVSLLDCKKCN